MATTGRYSPRTIQGDEANDGHVLTTIGGVPMWLPPASASETLPASIIDAKGDLIAGTANDTPARLAVGANGQVLTADSTQTPGVKWATPSAGFSDPMTTKGDLIARSAAAAARLGIGTDGQILTADSAQTLGMRWATPTVPVGVGNNDRRWAPKSTDTVIDEFRDSALAGAWTRVDVAGGTGRLVWTEDADVLSASIIGGDTGGEMHAMMIPLSGFGGTVNVGDYFYTQLSHQRTGNFLTGGVILADGIAYGAGNQVIGSLQNDSTTYTRSFTNYNTAGALSTISAAIIGGATFLRLICTAANTWRTDFSPDGVSWRLGGALARTITPTHVGLFGSSVGTATAGVVPFEFLRRGV